MSPGVWKEAKVRFEGQSGVHAGGFLSTCLVLEMIWGHGNGWSVACCQKWNRMKVSFASLVTFWQFLGEQGILILF